MRLRLACLLLLLPTIACGEWAELPQKAYPVDASGAEVPAPSSSAYQPPLLRPSDKGGVIADGLRSAAPGEIVTLAGAFAPGRTRFEIFGQTPEAGAVRMTVAPLSQDRSAATLLLPAGLPPASAYLIWPKTGGAYGRPFAINRTEVWWIGPKKAARGGRFAVYGRNLTIGGGQTLAYLVAPDGSGEWLRPSDANPYRLAFEAPERRPGVYALWLHNGAGGRLGWSGPLAMTLGVEEPAFSAATFDVRRYGAVGDGVHDDGQAIEDALAAAGQRPPATVYFPPGTYASRRAFAAPSGVRWLGAGQDRSLLRLTAPLDAPAFIYAQGDLTDVSIERIAVEADGMIPKQDRALVALTGKRVRVIEARLSSWGALTMWLTIDGLAVAGSEIIGSGSFLPSSSQVSITDNLFRMTNDGEAAIASWGGQDIAMIGNRLLNADESRPDGNGIGRLFVAQPHRGSVRNLYFSGNETVNGAPRDCAVVDCNKGEQILFEFGSVALEGHATAVDANGVTFPRAIAAEGLDVVVAGGRGVGQRRRVVSAVDGALTLDRPWDVRPNLATSLFYVTAVAERAVVYRNRFQGRASHSEHDSNSTAVLVWGLCYDMVVADNDIARMRHGIMVAATSGTPQDSVSAPYFALVEDNRISDGNNGLYTGLTFGYPTDPAIVGGIGNVFRRNDISAMSHIGVAFDTWDTAGGGFRATVFERNRLTGVRNGIVSGLKLIWSKDAIQPTPPDGTRLTQTILHDNSIDHRPPLSGPGVAFRTDDFQDWIEIGGEWTGFDAATLPSSGRRGAGISEVVAPRRLRRARPTP
ncbi:glycosyl hydrolase family 28-related protein [Hansschlegelia quercus]|uniref:glycosyl hydrolase family 28-related protein n=1 Tax=Hansschlegelia quercus TaxID=2528245 RepID=UPI002478F096|nr:glycosyl hydrolase family 28-related protein [Hansschlegelia quercus]